MNKLKRNKCDFCGDKFYKKVETPDMGWVNMCEGCYKSYMGCENCNLMKHLNQLHIKSKWIIVDADFDDSIKFNKKSIWNLPVLPKTRNEAILINTFYDNCEEIRNKFELRKKIRKRLYCKFFKICRGFYLESLICTHKGSEYCGMFRKFIAIERGKNPKLASHETLVLCPKCKNETLLVSDEAEFNMCINLNCCYFERKKNYTDAVGYSW